MYALIDGDLVLYRAASAVQGRFWVGYIDDVPVTCSPRKKDLGEYDTLVYHTMIDEDSYGIACDIIDAQIERILRRVGATEGELYLTGGNNFRREIYPEYKAHRPPKPILIPALTKYMVDVHSAQVIEGQEADDAMGIAQGGEGDNPTIICSYDKDMLMIPGKHFRFDRLDAFVTITEEEGTLNFYKQLLTGDRTDNIPGLKGIGPKIADLILEGIEGEDLMYDVVLTEYVKHKDFADVDMCDVVDTMTRNARLLWIRQEEGELWSPPV